MHMYCNFIRVTVFEAKSEKPTNFKNDENRTKDTKRKTKKVQN